MNLRAACLTLALTATPADAETDFSALSPSERSAFHREIRAVLLGHPELVRRQPIAQVYADEIQNDLDLIARHAPVLFDPTRGGETIGTGFAFNVIALFVAENCPDCDRAIRELQQLAGKESLRVHFFYRENHPDLTADLGVDTLPFYVFPKMMLRGHVPKIVLQRYLASGTGQ